MYSSFGHSRPQSSAQPSTSAPHSAAGPLSQSARQLEARARAVIEESNAKRPIRAASHDVYELPGATIRTRIDARDAKLLSDKLAKVAAERARKTPSPKHSHINSPTHVAAPGASHPVKLSKPRAYSESYSMAKAAPVPITSFAMPGPKLHPTRAASGRSSINFDGLPAAERLDPNLTTLRYEGGSEPGMMFALEIQRAKDLHASAEQEHDELSDWEDL